MDFAVEINCEKRLSTQFKGLEKLQESERQQKRSLTMSYRKSEISKKLVAALNT